MASRKGSSAELPIQPNYAATARIGPATDSSALRDSAATKASDNNEQERRPSYALKFHPNLTDGCK
jgi:hypothetical protein